MKSFEALCEAVRDFARAHPDDRTAVISDSAVYGPGMDVGIAMHKLKAIAGYAHTECGLVLFIENRADDEIRRATD